MYEYYNELLESIPWELSYSIDYDTVFNRLQMTMNITKNPENEIYYYSNNQEENNIVRGKNKIYIGSSVEVYINQDMISSIFKYLSTHEIYEESKTKPRKIGENYLLEIEINTHTKQLLQKLRNMSTIKLYKRTHSWEEIYKMSESTVKSS